MNESIHIDIRYKAKSSLITEEELAFLESILPDLILVLQAEAETE